MVELERGDSAVEMELDEEWANYGYEEDVQLEK